MTAQAQAGALRTPAVFRIVFPAVVLSLCLSFGLAAESSRQQFSFNVPAGEAEKTLKLFSEQAGLHLLFPTDVVAGVHTRAVAGEYSPTQALALMLAGTNLIAMHDEKTGALSVRRAPPPKPKKKAVAKRQVEPTGAAAADEPIELSPFTVRSDKDVGYLAANSLSGSRMDIRLKDSAASISVLTEEFIKDVGAFDISEALVFGNNTSLDLGEFGDFGSGQDGNLRIEFEQRYRVRGLPATFGRNYFKWSLPTDTYNIGRVEESRGPNSILFGVGSAGGIINVSTKQPMIGRRIRTLAVTAGSHNSRRAAIDLNQPLSDGRGAVRFNAVRDRSNTFRHFAFSENRRGHFAAKHRPTSSTQLSVEFERGRVVGNVPRTGALYDRSLPWIEAGRPTFSSTAPATDFADFGARLGVNQIRYISNLDRLIDMAGQILTTVPGPSTEITDPRHVDRSVNTGGPGQLRSNRFSTYSLHLQQQIAHTTFTELAFNHQAHRFSSFDPINSNLLFGDPNQTLPGEPGPNPFVSASLLETNWRLFERSEKVNALRASASSKLDARRWGLYRAAALGEYQTNRYRNRTAFETWEGRPFHTLPESGANRVVRRNYVTPNDWATYFVNGPAATGLIRNRVETITGRILSSTWTPGDGVNDDITTHKSVLIGLQAAYFGGRLVAGAGYRHDRLTIEDRGIVRDPITQIFEVDYDNVNVIKGRGETTALGVVGHVSKHVSLLYNHSRNIDVPNPNIRVLPDVAIGHSPKGEGRDYGIALDLFDGRIYARAVRFATDYTGELGFGGIRMQDANNNMLNSLLAAGLINQADYDARFINGLNGRTRDKTTDGYEFSLTANPAPGWRLQANWSITDGKESRIVPEVVTWWAEVRPYFARFPPDTPTGVGVNTIATTMATFQDLLDNWRSAEGVGIVGNRRHKANFFTRYTFSADRAKGLYIGGGYRYLGRMLVGRTEAGELQFAPPYGEGSFLMGRNLSFKNRRQLRLQLNVANVFDETAPIIVRYRSSGNPTQTQQVILRSPRTWRLTAEYSF